MSVRRGQRCGRVFAPCPARRSAGRLDRYGFQKGKSPFSRWLKLGLEWNDARTRENEMDIRPRGGFFTSHADSRNKGASKNRIGHGQVLGFQGPPVDGI